MATAAIRTIVFEKFRTVLQTQIPELQTIKFFAVVPADVFSQPLPALYLFEIAPEDRGYSNRIAIGTMHLQAQVFIDLTMKDHAESGFYDAFEHFDQIAGKLHTCFHTSVGLSKNGLVNIVELQYDRVITGEHVGMLNATFDVEYRHDRGNAFS